MAASVAALRPLDSRDAPAATRLLDEVLGRTPYRERAREILEAALNADPEWRVVGVMTSSLDAMAAFGPVLGAQGVWRIGYLVFASTPYREIGRQVVVHVAREARAASARMLVAELPADESIGSTLTTLRANGFRQEARIPDFYRDGVAQLFLRRDLTGDQAP